MNRTVKKSLLIGLLLTILLMSGKWSWGQTATPTPTPTISPTITPTPTITNTRAPIYKVGAIQSNDTGGFPILASDGSVMASVGLGSLDLVADDPFVGFGDAVDLTYNSSSQTFGLYNGPIPVFETDVSNGYTTMWDGCFRFIPSSTYVHFGSNMKGVPSVRAHDGGVCRISFDTTTLATAGDIYFLQAGIGLKGSSITNKEVMRLMQAGGIKFMGDNGIILSFDTSDNLFQFGNSTTADNAVIDGDDGTIKTNGKINLGAGSNLTVSSNAITITKSRHGVTAGSAAALNTINGGVSGDILYLSGTSAAVAVTVTDGAGNIQCGTNVVLDSANDWIQLLYDGSNWQKISSSVDN